MYNYSMYLYLYNNYSGEGPCARGVLIWFWFDKSIFLHHRVFVWTLSWVLGMRFGNGAMYTSRMWFGVKSLLWFTTSTATIMQTYWGSTLLRWKGLKVTHFITVCSATWSYWAGVSNVLVRISSKIKHHCILAINCIFLKLSYSECEYYKLQD